MSSRILFVCLTFLMLGTTHAAPGGFLGAYLADEPSKRAGTRVEGVAPGSPAEVAGLVQGDRILSIGGVPCEDADQVGDAIHRVYPGGSVKLVVLKKGKRKKTVELTLSTWGEYHASQPRSGSKTKSKPGEAVILASRPLHIGAPVVTWMDPDGYDGYMQRCHFDPSKELPLRPASGCNTPERYGSRRNVAKNLKRVVDVRGWTRDLSAVQIDQVVVHYDVAWTSSNCFKVLHDIRGLSCHFLLDVDGVLYQTLDLVDRARHAGSANDRSIGIEIAHPGVLTKGNRDSYSFDSKGPVFDLGRLAPTIRDPKFVVRPARPEPIKGTIHGRPYEQYDFTDAQYETLIHLFAGLNRALPGIRLEAPRGADGKVRQNLLAPAELEAFSGIVGHFHVSKHKQDPGPAFDWERVLNGARALRSKPRD